MATRPLPALGIKIAFPFAIGLVNVLPLPSWWISPLLSAALLAVMWAVMWVVHSSRLVGRTQRQTITGTVHPNPAVLRQVLSRLDRPTSAPAPGRVGGSR